MRPLFIPSPAINRVDAAIIYATMAHSEQMDKGGQPYIFHPLRVMQFLYPYRFSVCESDNLLISAVLHDVIEDCEVPASDICAIWGPRVSKTVQDLSHGSGKSRMLYLQNIFQGEHCLEANISRLVKIADMIDNSSPGRMHFLKSEVRERLMNKYRADLKQIQHYYKMSTCPHPTEVEILQQLVKQLK
jgi:(p)ppGpp synthase/HD superfamily hydrolase